MPLRFARLAMRGPDRPAIKTRARNRLFSNCTAPSAPSRQRPYYGHPTRFTGHPGAGCGTACQGWHEHGDDATPFRVPCTWLQTTC